MSEAVKITSLCHYFSVRDSALVIKVFLNNTDIVVRVTLPKEIVERLYKVEGDYLAKKIKLAKGGRHGIREG